MSNPYWMSYHRQRIDEMNDRIDACRSTQVDAINAGHKQDCKWVEVLGASVCRRHLVVRLWQIFPGQGERRTQIKRLLNAVPSLRKKGETSG